MGSIFLAKYYVLRQNMALTRPRAYQIYDIDYKQAVRVVSLSNVVLSAGAPNTVDGVSLSINDRILVAGQTNSVQNGIYYVTTLGSGSNGTWSRSIDTDATGELLSGTIVMVTEGTTYADTQWKLTTNDPISIGSTALTFVQNYLANSISYGQTSFAIGSSNANATISVAGTSNVAVFSTLGQSVAGNITATGNVSGTYLLGNVFFATGISASKIYNGTSEANIGTSGGNANISIGGTSNVVVVSSTGVAITGDLSVSGNATLSGNILGDRLQNGTTSIDIQTASGNANITVAGTSNVVVFSSSGQNVTGYLTSSGNITGGNLITAGLISATGNITSVGNISGSYILGNGSQLTGIVTGNSFGVITVSGQSDVVADQATDTLTLAAGTGIAITTNAGSDTITISSAATDSIFATGGDMGTVTEAVTNSEDLGTVTSAATVEYDLGTLTTAGIITPSLLLLPSYTVSQLGSLAAAPAGQFVYCSNESGGAVPAFSDGTNWRRVTDRAIVS